ncbi:MAG: alpha-glucan family phosphorylase [Dehalococcoidales bacterium]|nr:alpha-glucan family phosphorylase [Dehalococcoidales bacterium]
MTIAPRPPYVLLPPIEALTFAYFSMEIGIDPAMPTYSGGLGILAADTLRAAADLGLPVAGVTLLHRKGYFRQHLDAYGNQSETDADWSPEKFMVLLPPRALVTIGGRMVHVQAWRYLVRGNNGHGVPVYFLDTNIPENNEWERSLTDHLYIGDDRYRLAQQTLLGLGGVALLRALGYSPKAYHMNEGHSSLTTLALMEEQTWGRGLHTITNEDREAVRRRCVFTTHTPIAAGHDRFSMDLVRELLGEERTNFLASSGCCGEGVLNMTTVALKFSHYINGVSMRHEEISRIMFSNYPINSVTNGVHAMTWTSTPFQRLFDRYIPQWRRDNLYLRYAISIPSEDIRKTHAETKQALLDEVKRRTGRELDPKVMTIGFARRTTGYKRNDLLFRDPERLKAIARKYPFQVIYAGKAHPRDDAGKALIRRVFDGAAVLKDSVPVIYLEEYDIGLAKYLISGVDVWLNTPQKRLEASGTSGMKAALNGVPSFSILDGWWIEGHIEGVTGWSIGDGWQSESDLEIEAASLYEKLENVILPMFYQQPDAFAGVMRSAIALNGSYFNTQRMLFQYLQNAYLDAANP